MDNTLAIFESSKEYLDCDIINISPNQGLANALREGFNHAIKLDRDIVVVMDSDNTQNPVLIGNMILKIAEGNDIVIASRYRYGARVVVLNAFRRLLSKMASISFSSLIRLKGVKDYTCGFRAYNQVFLASTMRDLGEQFIEQKGFGAMVEILIKLGKRGAIITEIPMVLRYDQKVGDSKMNVKRTIIQSMGLLFKNAFK